MSQAPYKAVNSGKAYAAAEADLAHPRWIRGDGKKDNFAFSFSVLTKRLSLILWCHLCHPTFSPERGGMEKDL